VGHVLEPLLPDAGPGRPAEPVDRDRVDAVLREAEGELDVVRVEAADVGQDQDGLADGLRSQRLERREAVAVGRIERDLV
jgi:hypothetical protein